MPEYFDYITLDLPKTICDELVVDEDGVTCIKCGISIYQHINSIIPCT